MSESCTCPVCHGTGRMKVEESFAAGTRRYDPTWEAESESDTIACRNCGGQTMLGVPTGLSLLRPDGIPCRHEFVGVTTSDCYHIYTCVHCGYSYDIDSGD